MTKISILYPNTPNAKFDFEYYARKHMPRSIELLSKHAGYRGVSVERGVAGAVPGATATYIAMCHFEFTSAEAFMEAFVPNAPELQGDMKNYTDVQPVIQINEVLMSS